MPTSRSPRALPLVLLLLAACGGGTLDGGDGAPSSPRDGAVDEGIPDGAPRPTEAGTPDGGSPPDAGRPEASTPDAGPPADAGGSDGSGGSGGAYPGPQTRTASAGGATFEYHLYVPSAYRPGSPVPLLCLFHGQGGDGARIRDFWRDTAEREGVMLLATTSTGSSGGWFPSRDAPRFEAALNDALAAYDVDQRRIYVWGFSAGAHFVHAIALLNSDLFAAYAVSAGVLGALAGPSAPAEAARRRRIPVEIRVGRSDPLFPQAEADRSAFLSAGWTEGVDLRFTAFDGGHTLRAEDPAQLWSFLAPFRLP